MGILIIKAPILASYEDQRDAGEDPDEFEDESK